MPITWNTETELRFALLCHKHTPGTTNMDAVIADLGAQAESLTKGAFTKKLSRLRTSTGVAATGGPSSKGLGDGGLPSPAVSPRKRRTSSTSSNGGSKNPAKKRKGNVKEEEESEVNPTIQEEEEVMEEVYSPRDW
ncbi:hypothetical protein YB2330_002030 [Saitoella coloradoensis]